MILNATQSVLLQTMFLLMQKDTDKMKTLEPTQNDTCYGIFGCYEMSHPWTDELLRPVSFVPEAPEVVNPRFCLYTRRNEDACQKMKHELLKMSDCTVVAVDWSGGSGPPYPQAVANIRLYLDIILTSLRNGLDPAQPHFTGTDPVVRLDPTDADFVDVIHTDAGPFIHGGLGILHPVGHVDFYPNGGVLQPGCDSGVISYSEMSSFFQGFRKMLSCNHIRSYEYFIESINPGPCYFMGTECNSWEEFQNGTCFNCSEESNCPFQNRLGLHADSYIRTGPAYGSPLRLPPPRTHVKLYMMTGPEGPFCRHHYRFVWKISDSCKSLLHGGEVGMIWVTIHGDRETTREIKLSEVVQYYEPGNTYHTTVAGEPIGEIESVTLRITVCPEEGKPLTSRKILPLQRSSETDACNMESPRKQLSECLDNAH
ncbi:Pancreatic triacylglycerol lipase [Blattella germanica]|nr:Pancreatic triacylglycerol lipase [Blattella germanica]